MLERLSLDDNREMRSYDDILHELRIKYALAVAPGQSRLDLMIGHNPASPDAVQSFVESLFNEISIYPAEVIKKSKLDRVVVCKDLATEGTRVAGLTELAWWHHFLFWQNTMYLDVTFTGTGFGRSVFHHELFHVIDFHDDFWRHHDPGWAKLNGRRFRYGHVSGEYCGPTDAPGFVSDYSMTSVREDKAEFYSHMIVDYVGISKRAEADPVIGRKMRRMKELLYSFCDKFDDGFWSERASLSVPVFEDSEAGPKEKMWKSYGPSFGRNQEINGPGVIVWREGFGRYSYWKLKLTGNIAVKRELMFKKFNQLEDALLRIGVTSPIDKYQIAYGKVHYALESVDKNVLAELGLGA